MSEIKNGQLDQYGKVYSLNEIGGERVKWQYMTTLAWCQISFLL